MRKINIEDKITAKSHLRATYNPGRDLMALLLQNNLGRILRDAL